MSTLKTIEAIIDEDDTVHLREPIRLDGVRRAFIVIVDTENERIFETALLSEPALAEDWNRPEEDEAWSYLQPEL